MLGELLQARDHLGMLCRDVAFDVRAGECWIVTGRNGAGKTTLLQTLAGLRRPAGGTILLAGRAIAECAPRWRAQRLGFLAQDTFDAFPATALEIATTLHPRESTAYSNRAEKFLYCSVKIWSLLWKRV